MRIQHFVLTRFNVRFAFFINQQGHGEWPGADPVYLDRRLAFFEKYCLPGRPCRSGGSFSSPA